MKEDRPIAEPWRRLAASFLDTSLLAAAAAVALMLLVANNMEVDLLDGPLVWMAPLVCWAYVFISWSIGATPGMYALGIRIVRVDGRRMNAGAAAVRMVGYMLACLPFKAGLYPILTHPLRQGWHDQMARTVVVKSGAQSALPLARKPRLSDPAPEAPAVREALRGWWWALIYCTALTFAFTYPLARYFTTRTAGLNGDSGQFLWNYWEFSYALSHGEGLTSTHLLYYPLRVSLLYHTMDWVNCAAAAVLSRFFGPFTVYNILWAGSLALTLFTTYLLLASLTRSRLAAAVITPVYGLSSFMMLEGFGHMNMISAEFLPLFALAFYASLVSRRIGASLLAGVFLGMAGMCDYQFLLFGGILAVGLLAGLWRWSTPELRCLSLDRVKHAVIAFAVAGAIVSWLVVPAALTQASSSYMNTGNQAMTNRVNMANFFTIAPLSLSQRHGRPVTGDGGPMFARNSASTSMLAMALAAVCLLVRYRRFTAWSSALFIAVLMTNGPVLAPGHGEPSALFWLFLLGFPGNGFWLPWSMGSLTRYALDAISRPDMMLSSGTVVALPYLYLPRIIPMLRAFRTPVRVQEAALICLAALAAYGLKAVIDAVRAKFGKRGVAVLIAACAATLCYELLPVPYPVTKWPISPFYYKLAADKSEYAVVNIPLSDLESMMVEPAIHHKAVFDGHLSRMPRSAFVLLARNHFLQYCTVPSVRGALFPVDHKRLGPEYLRPDLAALGRMGARYVILHKADCTDTPGTEAMLEKTLKLPIVWDDPIIRAYRIP